MKRCKEKTKHLAVLLVDGATGENKGVVHLRLGDNGLGTVTLDPSTLKYHANLLGCDWLDLRPYGDWIPCRDGGYLLPFQARDAEKEVYVYV